MASGNAFLLDANILISPFKSYYAFDLAPRFWPFVEEKIIDGHIIILDKVYDELTNGNDDLSNWLARINPNKTDHRDSSILQAYRQVITHIQVSGFYTERALQKWSIDNVADPWLIACALAKGYTLVTFETPTGNLSKQSPISNPKIPDVCRALSVPCIDLFSMMRILSVSV
jgi:hypothetical protein